MDTAEAVSHLLGVPVSAIPGWRWSRSETPEGYEYRSPRALEVLERAGFRDDEVAVGVLACAAASEFSLRYPAYLLAGIHCILNDVRALYPKGTEGMPRLADAVLNRVTRGSSQPGYFGRQHGRWCASYQPPVQRSVEAARLALTGVGVELAHGGRRWLDLKVLDAGSQANRPLQRSEDVLRSRVLDGWKLVPSAPQIDQYILAILEHTDDLSVQQPHGPRTLTPRGEEELARALLVLADGRRRWNVRR